MIGSAFLKLAFAESAFAGFFIVSRASEARIILYFSWSLVMVWNLLHEMFVIHMCSCGEVHG